MRPRQSGRPDGAGRRVIPLTSRIGIAREAVQTTMRDRVAWLCLGLGILCGAGAVYYALEAMAN